MRKPLPKSEAVIGLLLLAVGGVSLSMMSAILLPRLFTSKKSWWLPRDGSTGRRITVSAENSTLPAPLRGALSRSNTDSLWEFSGSTSKKTVPVSFSYGPTEPNEAPPAIGWREAITIRVARAAAPLASMRMRSIDSAPTRRLDSIGPTLLRGPERPGRSKQSARLMSRPAADAGDNGLPAAAQTAPRVREKSRSLWSRVNVHKPRRHRCMKSSVFRHGTRGPRRSNPLTSAGILLDIARQIDRYTNPEKCIVSGAACTTAAIPIVHPRVG